MIEDIELDARFAQDPEALYRRLRLEAPVTRVTIGEGVRAYLVTRYADALALLKDPRLIKERARAEAHFEPGRAQPFATPLTRHMLGLDPPEHTRLRRLVVQAFTSRAVEGLQPRVEAIADGLLDGVDEREQSGPVDLMANFAEPLPLLVISEMFDMPDTLSAPFRTALGPLIKNASREDKATAEAECTEILEELIDHKRRQPGDDLLTALIHASVEGSQLTHEELLSMCFLLVGAGYETTVNLVGNGMLALCDHPSQMQLVREHPEYLPNAIEEMLRFDGPINNATLRYSMSEIVVGDVVIPPNEIVLITLLSANRDTARFTDPEAFDVRRRTQGHLAFGHGIHHCVGAPLARMEGVTAIGRLLARYTTIALDRSEPLEYHDSTLIRGLKRLPLWLTKS